MEQLKKLTKAEILKLLYEKQKAFNFEVPSFFYFTKKEFLKNSEKILSKIKVLFKDNKIIVRSSSTEEDQLNNSNAGKFKSFKNLKTYDKKLKLIILDVIKDFKKSEDQVIIQKFISKPDVSGVIFTRNINNNSPYYFLNLDSSGQTDLVTSGQSNPTMKTLVFFRNIKKYNFPNRFRELINSIQYIEKYFQNDRLDLEFCIKNKKIYIFQCRPLKKINKVDDKLIEEGLKNISMKIEKLQRKDPLIFGKKTFFSNMTDWNPAEMIGNKPTALSISLYAELITDTVWAEQRKNYGYSDLINFPLMINLGGSPYIDLRVDFNSFIPQKINSLIKSKSVNFYLKKIKKNKDFHDKVEFNIIETCKDLDTKKKLREFLNKNQTIEYSKELIRLTNNILNKKVGNFKDEINKINELDNYINFIKLSNLSHIHKIYYLVNHCKKLGTLPFAGLARSAFIVTKLLRSLVKSKILTNIELEEFYSSINTVTNKINYQISSIRNPADKKKFLLNYGHLRPSTYSITSKNYKENFKNYFPLNSTKIKRKKKMFKISKSKENKIDNFLKKNRLNIDYENFISFSKEAIKLREYSKFIFTKSIDEIFNNLIFLGKEINVKREDMEHISIKSILNYYSNLDGAFKLKKLIKNEIKQNKKNYNFLKLIELPDFIDNKQDIYFHEINKKRGNYITTRKTHGRIINLSKDKNFDRLAGKIILLKNADPGFDFIFSSKINGLITEYGGSNSHMSIRCMELGIPAIIGIGSQEFNFIRSKKIIEIDALQKNYRILN